MRFCPGCGIEITRKTTKLDFDPTSLFKTRLVKICVECGQVLEKQK